MNWLCLLRCRNKHKTLCLLLLLYAYASVSIAQETRYFQLQPGSAYSVEQFGSFLSYLEDVDHSYSVENCCVASSADWATFHQSNIDFGFSSAKFWLKLPIKNVGNDTGEWILDLNTRFMNGLDAYLVSNNEVYRIIRDSEDSTFAARKIPYRHVVARFALNANQEGFLVIGYWSRGTTALPLTIETETSFFENWISENVIIVAFYSAMMFMMLFGLAQFVILKRPVQLSYALYVAAGCLYIFHMDGLSFKYFWPNYPKWNADASLLLGLNIGIFSIIFARTFLNTPIVMPKMDRVLKTILIGTLVLMLASFVIDVRHLKQYAFLVTTSAVFLCLMSGLIAYLRGQKDARFYVLGWVGLFLSTAFASVSHLIEKIFPIPLTFDFAKLGIFVDGIMFAMAMADQANEVRKQRDQSQQRERELLQQDLEAQKQINLLENQYQNALTLAQQKSYTLASAGHDLRQPIVALKSAMNQVTQRDDIDPKTVNQFRQGFDYIEKLIKEYLDLPEEMKNNPISMASDAKETLDKHHLSHRQIQKSGDEVFPISIILNNVYHMFREDAEKKELCFKRVNCSARVRANPVSVMRLLSNLVENAIKYTNSGKVLLGCRRRANGIEIQIWDTGVGFTEDEKQTYFNAYQRKADSSAEGSGLGLSIVRRLVDENGYSLILCSAPQCGSVFKILIPEASSS